MAQEGHVMLDYDGLSTRYRKLLTAAKDIIKTGYNPYTNSKVGAAVLTAKGEIISASNIVPKARSANLCAERAVIAKANSMDRKEFVALAVVGRSGRKKPASYMYTPCGTCRQFIHEFAKFSGRDVDVIMSNSSMTKIIVLPISKLLPLAFQ